MYNLGQKDIDKLTKLSKTVFAIECFTADFLQDFIKIAMKILDLLGIS